LELALHEFAGRATGNACPEVVHPILNEAGHGAWSRDRRAVVHLTPLQFALLRFLAQLPPHAVGRYPDIAEAMRPLDRYPLSDDRIRWHAANVRKLVSSPEGYQPPVGARAWPPRVIVTIHGVGLRLDWSIRSLAHEKHTQATR
jgi:DNA-binding response OmpR family regulator